ncbi:LysR family transcriptional regulator [Pseudoruegeria sp. SHC-113]|uniref:LysR family transcriptional regulator n=1 Tax=Pseudoruegeria sp. SHC-113 TaxID=2855439 RepID=UPI0021BB514B|nr:LysR family transcriptional regulator [Pseudoruegeria sp. SHC-113]MCT8158821.1 LysR family transcriptional regulator [Pseudoruegeria sp. SHC-113]
MDWRSVSFDWNRARAFLVTAEEGSLSAAARALRMTQPTLGRQVAALEEELGVALFERTGTRLSLTAAGRDLVEHVRLMGEAAAQLSLTASGQSQSLEGDLCITASEFFSAHILPELAVAFRAQHPGIHLEILAANEVRDLRRREADIAIRNAEPTQPDLIARKLGESTGGFYAATSLLEAKGRPQTPEDLLAMGLIGFADNALMVSGLNRLGYPVEDRHFVAVSNSHLVQWELARAGMGVGIFPCLQGDADPLLERVLPSDERLRFPVWLVAHREVKTNRRVRLAFDFLAAHFPIA